MLMLWYVFTFQNIVTCIPQTRLTDTKTIHKQFGGWAIGVLKCGVWLCFFFASYEGLGKIICAALQLHLSVTCLPAYVATGNSR